MTEQPKSLHDRLSELAVRAGQLKSVVSLAEHYIEECGGPNESHDAIYMVVTELEKLADGLYDCAYDVRKLTPKEAAEQIMEAGKTTTANKTVRRSKKKGA